MDDLEPAGPPPTWTLDQLEQLLDGADVYARDDRAAPLPVPAALAELGGTGPPAWNDQLATVHPEDRAPTVRAWWDALTRPGHVVEARARYRTDGRWAPRRVLLLDLRHQADVGVVLVGIVAMDAAADDDEPAAAAAGSVASWGSPAWIVQHLDAIGTIQATEGRVEELFGRPPDELVGTNILDALHPDDHPAALAMWVEVLDGPGQTRTIRQRIGRPDGTWVWIESTVTNRLDPGAPDGGAVVAVSHDVTQRLAEEAELRASREELRTLAEEVPVAVFRADPDGRITYGNARWYGVLATIGPVDRLEEVAHADEVDRLRAAVAEALHPTNEGTGAVEVRAADGDRRFAITWRRADADGQPEALLGVLTDVTDTAELRRQAEQDELTGLLNRRALEDRLAALLTDGAAALAFVDLDGFKAVNDDHGHHVGDAVLTEVGRRLAGLGDVVAGRWGGDEFVLVVAAEADDDLDALADQVAQQVDDLLAVPVEADGVTWTPTASVGVAAGRPGDRPSDLLRQADAGMYASKRQRR